MTTNMSSCMPPTLLNCPTGKSCKSGVGRVPWHVNVNVGAVRCQGTGLPGTPAVVNNGNILDERVGMHFVLYPQPIGFQAEWNWGHGPQLNATRTAVEEGTLQAATSRGCISGTIRGSASCPMYVGKNTTEGGRTGPIHRSPSFGNGKSGSSGNSAGCWSSRSRMPGPSERIPEPRHM